MLVEQGGLGMGFFPDPHDRDSSVPEEGGEPEWAAPPIDVIPIVVPILLVLGRSESAAVLLTGVTAYPTGLSVSVSARIRYRHPDGDLGLDLIFPSPRHSDPSWHAERLKWGFEYVDGRRATSDDPCGVCREDKLRVGGTMAKAKPAARDGRKAQVASAEPPGGNSAIGSGTALAEVLAVARSQPTRW